MPTTRHATDPVSPGSLIELLEILGAESGVRFWRGIPDRSWSLDSSLARRLAASPYGSVTEGRAQFTERDLLERARHRGFDIINGQRIGDFELLALLRHHGAATRLVDFTRSATVALWFAVSQLPEQDGSIIGVHTDHVAGFHEGQPAPDSYADLVAKLVGSSNVWGWSPPAVSPRVAAQHSQLLFSKIEGRPHGTLLLPTEPDAVLRLQVPAAIKGDVRAFLRNVLDIDFQAMFPDLPGFALAFSAEPTEDPYRW